MGHEAGRSMLATVQLNHIKSFIIIVIFSFPILSQPNFYHPDSDVVNLSSQADPSEPVSPDFLDKENSSNL